MSDTYYREQSARRTRIMLLGAVIVLVLGCIGFGVYSAFWDTCTRGFDRQPEAVVASFANAVVNGDASTAAACWHHLAYLDVASGCSEICLSRLWGTPYQIEEIRINPDMTPLEGRAGWNAQVSLTCPDGEQHTAEITLDGISSEVPWRHWKIVHSTFGGPLSEPWCN
jgi:hypothetical protein